MATVWQVGDPAGGPAQFRGGALTQPGCDEVVVDVADPDRAEVLPQVHPGPLAAYAGGTDKRLTLTFDLPERPTVPHRLLLRGFAVQGPVPELAVDLNGHTGLVVPDVQRDDRRGVTGVSAIAGWFDVALPVDPAWLRPGGNRLTLTTTGVELVDPAGDAHPALPGFWGSAISYGAISLERLDRPEPPDASAPEPALTVRPTPLYVEVADGLAELVDVLVGPPLVGSSGSLVLEVGDDRVEAPVDLAGHQLGQVRVRLEVPEQPGPVAARLTLRLDGREHVHDTTFRPCRKWTLHLMPHVHLDLGYTDYQAKVEELHTRNVDRVLDILDDHPEYAYSVDGSYVVEQYLRTRGPEAVARLEQAVVGGQVSVNAFYTLFLTGLATLEECFRAGRHAADLRRSSGTPLDYANLTDVPSYSGALPTVLAAMGVPAFLGVQNHGRAANDDSDELHLRSPFRWQGPDGSEVLTFFADCYAQLRFFCGYPVSVPGAAQSFSRFVSRFERDDYLPTDLPIVGIYSDNEDLADGEADFVARWASSYAYPELRFSTVADYFAAVRPLQDELPVVRGDGGSYWEDGVGAGAAVIAGYRRAQVGLAAAETLASLVSSVDDRLRPALGQLDGGWDALLVGCEHTWTSMHAHAAPDSDQAVDQLAWKRHHVETAQRAATDEARRALSQLGELVTTDGPTVLVANPLGWERDIEADVELPAGRTVVDDADVVDVDTVATRDGVPRARMTVRAVPPFGYRAVPLHPAGATDGTAVDSEDGTDGPLEVDTGCYRLRVADGRVTSLWSHTLDRELLDPASPYALGEVLYVRGGGRADREDHDARTTLHDRDPWLPRPDLEVVPASTAVAAVRRGRRSTTVELTGSAPSLPRIGVQLRFRDDADRVDVTVGLDKEAVRSKESVYVAFPFAVPGATARYDRQVGWVDPTVDHLPGACNEWFTTLFGVGLENADVALHWTSVDAPLFTLGDVVRGRWSTQATAGDGTILSWVMNNYWWTNFPPSQQGPLELRYAFRPAARWDVTEAVRFGREVRTRGVVGVVDWLDKMDTRPRVLPAAAASLLPAEVPPNVVATVVAGRVRHGPVVRLQEVAGVPAEARIEHPAGPSAAATLVTALEDEIEVVDADADGIVAVAVPARGVTSVRLDAREVDA